MMQSLKMALKSLSGNKLRALLTMLGIIIGVMALVVLVSLVSGATGSITSAVSDLGSDLLTVTVSDDKGDPVKLDTLTEWSDEDGIGEIAPSASASATAKYSSTSDSMTVYGTTPSYYNVEELNLLLGRFLMTTDVDNNNYVCVINETTATDLVGYLDCVGEEISIDGMKFTIIGVLEDNDSSLTAAFSSGSMVAYIPYTTLLRLSSSVSTDITEFYVSAAEDSDTTAAETAITALLMERFDDDEDAFSVSSQNVLEDTVSSITSILTALLGGIAAISLLVGGIGIMNIMLVTVTERTREIGIRKAIGATRGVILRQFLIEAVVICMIGCSIGIFLSWIILQLVSVVTASMGLSFVMNGRVVLIAIVFCFCIGVVFGLYPANKAAKMKPIDALHYGG
ncbi:MAG: ABC transporter permease [Lachnospiraceae bacterium]|nr:ABC transporter permease [Lachnospiraceae bacterium]